MAQELQIAGAGATAKVRSPVAVAILTVVTLGIYLLFWWYFINRELADYGRAKGTAELGDSPGKSTLEDVLAEAQRLGFTSTDRETAQLAELVWRP